MTAGGMKLVASVSRSAGSARWRCLALISSSWVRIRRRSGSGSSVGIGTIIIDTRLPKVPCCSSVRTDTGTIATSGSSGRSSWSISHSRSAEAQRVTTTSLTVMPAALLIALTVSSETWPMARRRWGEIFALNDVVGARAVVTSSTSGSSSEPSSLRARVTALVSVGTPGNAFAPGRSNRLGRADGAERNARTG